MTDEHQRGRLTFRLTASTGAPGGRDEPLGLAEGRDGVLYVPDTAERGAPLMVFLHGATGTGRSHMRLLLGAADRYGVAVLAPDSRTNGSWDLIASRRLGPDVAFIERALEAAVDRVDVDVNRLMIGGISDGASYALTIGLANGDVFSSVVAFSPGFLAVPDAIGQPRVFVSHGTRDEVLPIDMCSRGFVPTLVAAGYDVRFREFDGGHTAPPPVVDEGVGWALQGP